MIMNDEEFNMFVDEILGLPKTDEIPTASSMCSLKVDELLEVIKAFEKVPLYNELIYDNNKMRKEIERLNNELTDLQNRFDNLMEAHKICDEDNDRLNNIIDKTISRCNYLLNNEKIIINNKEYIKQPADDYITQYIKEVLNGGVEEN